MKFIQNSRKRNQGLTLIELLLVLVVLIATSGILVAVFPNIIGQAHSSSGAGNIAGIARQMENHRAMIGGYPDELDLLLDDSTATGALAPFGGTVAATELTTAVPSARTIDALLEAGITTLIRHEETPDGDEETQTIFDGTAVAVSETGPAPGEVVVLGTDAIERLGLETDGVEAFVALGLGNSNDGIGRSMAAAPVHYLPDGGSNEDIYSRYLLVFSVPDEEGAVRLATVAAVDVHEGAGEVIGLDGHISEYHHSRE